MRVDREVLRRTFGQRDFRLLWGDSTLNAFGMSGEQVVLSLLVFQVTGSSVWVGLSLGLYFVPSLFVGALAGAVADWMDRRELVRRCELSIAIALGAFGLLLVPGVFHPAQLPLMAVVSGGLRAMYIPARFSYAYDLVGPAHAVGGLAVLNLAHRIGQLTGALAAGATMHYFGAHNAYLVLAAAHGLGFLALVGLRSAGVAAEIDSAPLKDNLRAMGAELRTNHTLLALILVMVAVAVLGFSHITVLPELATRELGAGAQALGLMHAARAAGGLVGVAVLGVLGLTHHRGLFLVGAVVGFGAGLVLLGASSTFAIAIAGLTLAACATAIYDVLTQSVMQLIVPNRLRGRAMGIWVLMVGIEPIGHVLVGAMAAGLGVALAMHINGGLLLLIGVLVAMTSARLRAL